MARTPLLAGNWKMNMDHLEATHLVQKLAWTLGDAQHDFNRVEVAVFPPFTDIRSVQTLVDSDELKIAYGAQDVSAQDNGAFTGDISVSMLTKLGCSYVIVGHSERRQYHGETDTEVGAKAAKALAAGIVPVICCGDALEVREAGKHVEHVLGQIDAMFSGWEADAVGRVVVAYEPIWAIGTGKVATPADAQEVCGAIRARISERFGAGAAESIRVLYGGSAKPGNIKELMAQRDIDGALVGGASLKPEDFAAMAEYQKM